MHGFWWRFGELSVVVKVVTINSADSCVTLLLVEVVMACSKVLLLLVVTLLVLSVGC